MEPAAEALSQLTDISSQVEAAVLFDRSGTVAGATLPDERAARLASTARALLEAAEQVREGEIAQLEASTGEGSLFVIRDGEQLIAAATGPEPTSGLVFYDLTSCLRRATDQPKPKRRTSPKRTRPKSSGSS